MAETEWVLVPRNPSPEMLNAAIDVDSFKLGDISPLGFRCSPQQLFEKCYTAMLSTAPAPPVAGETRAWRCFHCDEVFTDIEDAAAHFMLDGDQPACCLAKVNGDLAKVILTQQKELAAYRNEDTATIREVYGLGAKHFREMRSEEEKGYARGLADGRNESLRTAAKVAQARAEFEFHPENADFLRGYETGYKAAAQAIVLDIRALSPSPPTKRIGDKPMIGRNIHEAATRLKDAAPEELQEIATHDWDMIRDVAAEYLATPSPPTEAEGDTDDGLQAIRGSIRKGARRSDHRFRLENPSEEIAPETERLRKALEQRDAAVRKLVGATWQVLDDMGADGHSCCGLAKAELRIAFEPFHDIEEHDEMDMPLAEAIRIVKECDDAR